MPFELDPWVYPALAMALVGAAYVRGYSGFGFSAIFIAFAALLTNPLPLISVVFGCEILMTAFQARDIRRHIDWPRVLTLLGGAVIALPLSVWTMLSLDENTVRVVVSLIVLIMSLILLSGWTLQRQIKTKGHLGVGAISGLCNSAGVGGLPVAAFMTAQPMPAATFRASMIVYLTGLDLMTLPLLWAGGLVTADTGIGLAMAFPLLGIGIWLGTRRFQSTSPEGFRKFAILLLLVLATLGLLRASI